VRCRSCGRSTYAAVDSSNDPFGAAQLALGVGGLYRGSDPYSEPEARNVRWSFLRRAPITAITHHTSGEIMLHPWGRDPDRHRTRDWTLLNDIGLAMQEPRCREVDGLRGGAVQSRLAV